LAEAEAERDQLKQHLDQHKATVDVLGAQVTKHQADKLALKAAFDDIHGLNDHYQSMVEDPEDGVAVTFQGAKAAAGADPDAAGHIELTVAARYEIVEVRG
jgi:hypothetical protein